MEFFNPQSNIDFMGARKWTGLLSSIIFVLSIAALMVFGLKWGLDFTGGTQIEISFPQSQDVTLIREQLNQSVFKGAQVISYGTSKDFLVSIGPQFDVQQIELGQDLQKICPGSSIKQIDYIGPQIGKELAYKGFLAILISLIGTMVYIAFRFELRLAVSSAVALIHDPVLILGVFAFFGIDFDLKALAGLLAVIGYSLNDTIVVFDRVRENFRTLRRLEPMEIMNRSINQTLSRTIMTSVLTLLVVVSLFLFGGETIHGFSLALMIGIVIGTYSSIYVAGTLAILLGLNRNDFMSPIKKEEME